MSISPEIRTEETIEASPPPRSRRGDWTWELVTSFPQQGRWTEDAYLSREFDGLVEYSDGVLEFLPMPTWMHQLIVDFLHSHLKLFVRSKSLGLTAFAPLRVRIRERQYREPDVLFVTPERFRGFDQPCEGADLVMEVLSGSKDDRERDLIAKRADYAAAEIPEYWIVDPVAETITVLSNLVEVNRSSGQSAPTGSNPVQAAADERHQDYLDETVFRSGDRARSVLLNEFEIDVAAVFAAAKP